MSLLDAVIVGIVQGLTEFLPISSSGHLVVLRYFVPIHDLSSSYIILLHAGTLIAVVGALWRDIYTLIRTVITGEGYGRKIAVAICVATIPGAFFGYFFGTHIDAIFCEKGAVISNIPLEPYKFVGLAFIITAAYFLHTADNVIKKREEEGTTGGGPETLSWSNAVLIGCAQALAIFPGISRSGATIAAGLKTGLSRELAVRFSFLLSIPIILGSFVNEIPELRITLMYESDQLSTMLVGVAVAAVSGFIAINWMLKLIVRHDLRRFVMYLWILGLLCIAS